MDDLNTPLGKRPARSNARWKALVLPLITGVLGAMVVAALAWVVLVDDPLGGEPVATAAIEIPQAKNGGASPASDEGVQSDAAASGERTVTIIDGKSGSRTQVSVAARDRQS